MTKTTRLLTLSFTAVLLTACESGDINLSPTNVSNGGGGGGGGGASNPCASYVVAGTTRQGSYDGTNCTYDSAFVSESNPLTVNLRIPRISGVHIFADSLYVGAGVEPPGIAAPGGTGPTLIIDAGNTLAFNAADNILINRGSTIRPKARRTSRSRSRATKTPSLIRPGLMTRSFGPASSSTATGSRTTATTRSVRPVNATFSVRASRRATAAMTTPRAPAYCATSS